jgi:hypothetical protein
MGIVEMVVVQDQGASPVTAVKVGVERPKPISREVIELREEVEILGLRPKPLAGIVTGWEQERPQQSRMRFASAQSILGLWC